MPIQPTYPGVYIEEVPSGVRTLTGVATSITAFIGSALRGPVDEPVFLSSYAEFERTFGGLWVDSDMSYAIRDFFQNGGSQAVIVRVFNPSTGTGVASLAVAGFAAGTGFTLHAASPGTWGSDLTVTIEYVDVDGTGPFNLILRDSATGNEEKHLNLVVDDAKNPRYLPAVLKNQSTLAQILDDTTIGTPAVMAGAAFDPGNDGAAITATELEGSAGDKTGLYALEKTDLFNLLCIPDILGTDAGSISATLATAATTYCEQRRAVLLIDAPPAWNTVDKAIAQISGVPSSTNAAIYFPRLMQPDPLRDGKIVSRPSCGAIAGVIARTDGARGLWKAPAGLDAYLNGVPKLSMPLTDAEIGRLNPLGINCMKATPAAGRVVWGARTRKGADQLSSEWKYIPVRRLALNIEESLYRGTQWVVFEPNDEPLWAQIRLNVGAFMNDLFRKGAFQGSSPGDAYFVKCDKETTTQSDINQGIVNIMVGFAPLKPAEFVIIKLQQMAGQLAA